jgi:7-cyano-7-deazaguanine synthase
MPRRAVVLVSGGLDSATVLAIARDRGYETHALTVDYGQRHRRELAAARRVTRALGAAAHRVVRVDLRAFGGSALTSAAIPVPKGHPSRPPARGIPVTYVPARNTVLLALALAWAETLGARDLFLGVNAVDYSGYPDCRPAYVRAFERLAGLATKAGTEGRTRFRIRAPLLRLTKARIIRTGIALGVDYGLTHSCYDPAPRGRACGRCDSCRLRRKGFAEAGARDPVPYADPI